MRFLKNRYFLITISAFIAIIITFIIIPTIINKEKDTVTVVRVKENTAPYTIITDDMLELREVGAYNIAPDILTKKEDIIGKYTNTMILPGDNLFSEKFLSGDELDNGFLYDLADENSMAVTVTLKSAAAGLSGMLMTGDIVSALVYTQNNDTGGYYVAEYPELSNLEVLKVYKNTQTDSDEIKNVTFKVNYNQALKLIAAENEGTIHLIFIER